MRNSYERTSRPPLQLGDLHSLPDYRLVFPQKKKLCNFAASLCVYMNMNIYRFLVDYDFGNDFRKFWFKPEKSSEISSAKCELADCQELRETYESIFMPIYVQLLAVWVKVRILRELSTRVDWKIPSRLEPSLIIRHKLVPLRTLSHCFFSHCSSRKLFYCFFSALRDALYELVISHR